MLGNDLQMSSLAIPDQLPVLELEEPGEKEERHEVEEDQTAEGLPEELTEVVVPMVSRWLGSCPHRLCGHAALYMGQPGTGSFPWTRLESSNTCLAPMAAAVGCQGAIS